MEAPRKVGEHDVASFLLSCIATIISREEEGMLWRCIDYYGEQYVHEQCDRGLVRCADDYVKRYVIDHSRSVDMDSVEESPLYRFMNKGAFLADSMEENDTLLLRPASGKVIYTDYSIYDMDNTFELNETFLIEPWKCSAFVRQLEGVRRVAECTRKEQLAQIHGELFWVVK